MGQLEAAKRSGQSDVLSQAASSIETAVVGIVSLVLPSDELDQEVQGIKQEMFAHAHRLRQIAILIGTDKR